MKKPLLSVACAALCLSILAASAANEVYNVRDYGAKGDGATKDTAAFQSALDACAVAGGGDVLVPAGNYLIGSIQLGKATILRLATNSVLTGSPDAADYPTLDVRWEGFTVTQGGNWATHPTYCTDVSIKNLTITGARDGIDVDSCSGVKIEHCDISTGDDSISLKSGRGLDGARIGKPTGDVLISDCSLRDSHFACVGIGSETSGGIRNVRIEHCAMNSRSYGVYIKTRIGRAGVIGDISGEDLDILSGGFLRVNLIGSGNSNTADDPVPGPAGWPTGKNFRFKNIRVNCTTLADLSQIAPEKPLDGFVLSNVTGICKKGITLHNIVHASLDGINVTGFQGQLLTQTNVQGSGLSSTP